MNKKMLFSVAAAAALLVSNPVVNKAEAASNCPTPQQVKVYYSQPANINSDQVNSILQKYLKNYNIQLDMNELTKQFVQQPVQQKPVQQKPVQQQPVQQKPVQQQPAVQKPVQKPVQQQPVQQQPAKAPTAPASSSVSAFEQKVVELTNQQRAKYGVPALQLDVNLSKVARAKSSDMKAKGYFDHNSPTYGSPFDMMKSFGITYRTAGENIAMGQRSPEEVVNAWMNSEGHRKNILNANFTHIGVGHVAEGNYWTQMFIGK
ncbi:CAP domain-containing protein [Bacillus sp. DTU_2020_1000418_1_SI_GHA_SEK_038]|uniref:CAP domain-containing protein n=1 Tax=Bacillus sp. DTU_2020_1000418_1_SI_GHA_SEK_038 TaxID=3077585 RepID=UPI0028F061E0|nr:CAP domain-containing protein [Bacillus sp. DTU_2020_1000418_1_SI_GHA_SEK_038]WNS73868.1 CAP domain-containing protein [Bacillus sp. DTU_2020_1000418_1_SI_GHA_SEK_038]